MPTYRFYVFEKNAHLSAPPKIYDLPNDAAALEAARTINGYAVEVWCHTKKVGRLNPRQMSAVGGEADITPASQNVRF